MELTPLLDALFPLGHAVTRDDDVLGGTATTAAGEVTVIGTANKLEVGVDHALALAATVLASTRAHPRPGSAPATVPAERARPGRDGAWFRPRLRPRQRRHRAPTGGHRARRPVRGVGRR